MKSHSRELHASTVQSPRLRPTADILPPATDTPAGQQAHAQAKRYFHTRPITHPEVTGNDNAHDPEASLLFTFLEASDQLGAQPETE